MHRTLIRILQEKDENMKNESWAKSAKEPKALSKFLRNFHWGPGKKSRRDQKLIAK